MLTINKAVFTAYCASLIALYEITNNASGLLEMKIDQLRIIVHVSGFNSKVMDGVDGSY